MADLAEIAALGIDLDEVAQLLEDQGVASFEKAFTSLIESLEAKAKTLS